MRQATLDHVPREKMGWHTRRLYSERSLSFGSDCGSALSGPFPSFVPITSALPRYTVPIPAPPPATSVFTCGHGVSHPQTSNLAWNSDESAYAESTADADGRIGARLSERELKDDPPWTIDAPPRPPQKQNRSEFCRWG